MGRAEGETHHSRRFAAYDLDLPRRAIARGRDRLPLHRLAAFDRLAVGGVMLEEHRQAVALAELRRVLQVEVQVRFAGVAAVAAAAELVAGGDLLAGLHRNAAPAQVGEHGDRKSVVSGKSVSVRVDLGGRRLIKKKTKVPHNKMY